MLKRHALVMLYLLQGGTISGFGPGFGPDSGRAHAAPESAPLVVLATLVDAGPAVPHCGFLKFTVVMRYAVVQVLEGQYPASDLYVAHSCKEMALRGVAGKPGIFQVGDVHRLSLRSARPASDWQDYFTNKTPPRYLAVAAAIASAGATPPAKTPAPAQ